MTLIPLRDYTEGVRFHRSWIPQEERVMIAKEEMISDPKYARFVWALFPIALLTYLFGASLIESILNTPDYLLNISAKTSLVITGVLLKLINVTAVIGIAVMIFPIFQR